MPTQVVMPQLGESVFEGTITKWLKTKGERVEEFEPLLEINTDKVDTEIPSPATGILLDILVPEGTTVKVGELLAYIGGAEESVESLTPAAATPTKSETVPEGKKDTAAIQPSAAKRDKQSTFISPVVSRIAAEEGIDLSQIKGSGQGGRITKNDLLIYLENRNKQPAVVTSVSTGQAPPTPTPSLSLPAGQMLPMTPVRRAIAEHMTLSKHTSPHVSTIMEADLSRVVAHRQEQKEAFARAGVNLTFTAYFVSAAVAALKAYPIVNSSWSEQGIILHPEINIGMATSLGDAGLIVPVIKNADRLSLLGLAQSINDLASRARARQLKPDEVKGGTFSLTNHGVSGSLFATPIINQPQCAILGVGAIQKRVVVLTQESGDTLAIRPMVYLGLTFDHRILDGAIADHFLSKVIETLQDWR